MFERSKPLTAEKLDQALSNAIEASAHSNSKVPFTETWTLPTSTETVTKSPVEIVVESCVIVFTLS